MTIPKLKFWNMVSTSEDEAELYVYGPIVNGDGWVYEYFGEEVSDKVAFVRDLNALGAKKNITVYINSDGGDVYAAHTIHNVLKRNKAAITVYIDGIAASAASVIAMAADKLIMPVNATLMIHDPLIGISGYFNAEDLAGMKDLLDQVKNSIVAAYMIKSNLTDKEISKLMSNETYMTGKQALEMGFADEVLYDKTVEVVNAGKYAIVNSLAVDTSKMKNNPFLKHEGEEPSMPGTPGTPGNPVNSPVPAAPPVVPPVAAPQAAAIPLPIVDAAAAERERLKGIDAIAANIDSELVNDAKYNNPISAEQLAFKAMKEGKMLNAGLFNQAVAANAAAGTGSVQGQTLEQGGEKEYDLNNLKDVNAVFSTFAAASQSGRPQNLRRG
ncbi:head maturation protease, ClpP-related [Paenibacillus piscarius]|uniref:head maturation protease, ClpP-related n=1 Tax=Paenibacillus piscarius TaxID=1089681 RepID=UPI001EE9650D|nr:head maturation protease, ClpP-related [Paenibacillus piscarius]